MPGLDRPTWRGTVTGLANNLVLPEIDDKALAGLKFAAALPRHLAQTTLATRLADLDHATATLSEPTHFTTD